MSGKIGHGFHGSTHGFHEFWMPGNALGAAATLSGKTREIRALIRETRVENLSEAPEVVPSGDCPDVLVNRATGGEKLLSLAG